MSVVEKTIECAACGRLTNHPIGRRGRSKDFCSPDCIRVGRAFCKQCGGSITQLTSGKGSGSKDFCKPLCQRRYYHGSIADISPSLQAERYRTTCKGCGKLITQPKSGGRMFCGKICGNRYRDLQKRELNLTEEWGMFAPETRKSLREIQQLLGIGAAKRMAVAIEREYVRRRPDKSSGDARPGMFLQCKCKTCGKEFRRRPWTLLSKDYCSIKCNPAKREMVEKGKRNKLTWKQVDEIRRLYATEHTSTPALAEKYGINNKTVWSIVNYKIWQPEYDPRVEGHQQRKYVVLTWEKVDEIRNLLASGLPQNAIAEKFGISASHLSNIAHYKLWKPEHDPRRKSEVSDE